MHVYQIRSFEKLNILFNARSGRKMNQMIPLSFGFSIMAFRFFFGIGIVTGKI